MRCSSLNPLPCARRRFRLTVICAHLVLLVLVMAGCGGPKATWVLEGDTMGTRYQVRLAERPADPDALRRSIEAELDAIDREMSTWREDSHIARFNRSRNTDWFPLPPRLAAVLARSEALSRETKGAFDITLRPLSAAWGFQGSGMPSVPPPEILARITTGMDRLKLSPGGDAVGKTLPALELDVSGIAKGYAVDRLAGLVAAAGVGDYLVEIGGEVRAAGERPAGGPWRVAMASPAPGGEPPEILALRDEAVASSGDYRNGFDAGGRRYGHVLDPVTGQPADHGVAAVTVLARDAMTADALATAFMVMAPREALAVADRLGVAVRLSIRTGDRIEHLASADFERRITP